MGQNNTTPILITKEKAPTIWKTEELLFIAGKANGQYWEWLCSWRIEVAPSGPCAPQKPPWCTLWLRAQMQAMQVRRKPPMDNLVAWELMFNLDHPENYTWFHSTLELTLTLLPRFPKVKFILTETVIRTTITLQQVSEDFSWGVNRAVLLSLIIGGTVRTVFTSCEGSLVTLLQGSSAIFVQTSVIFLGWASSQLAHFSLERPRSWTLTLMAQVYTAAECNRGWGLQTTFVHNKLCAMPLREVTLN